MGGWLASEAFEYLLGCPEIDESLRNLLWRHKLRGGFEDALAELQVEVSQRREVTSEVRLRRMQDAVLRMFSDMDKAFAMITNFEFQNDRRYLVRNLLVQFDALFTLNQDLLLERHYLNGNVALSSSDRWTGWEIPGMRASSGGSRGAAETKWSPLDPSKFVVNKRLQPCFKLHGSSNWIASDQETDLIVIGGNKPSTIDRHPILKWNYQQFREHLFQPNTHLMIIGYGFRDEHINRVIGQAAEAGHLEIFIIDPLGLDVADENRTHPVYSPGRLFSQLQPHLIGASRRSLRETFGADRVEHAKVMRFLLPA